jgi:hypothetical protein
MSVIIIVFVCDDLLSRRAGARVRRVAGGLSH